MTIVHRGHLVHISGSPTVDEAASHLAWHPDGAVAVGDSGVIEWSGAYTELPIRYREEPVTDHGRKFIVPGFVDTHIHFPQVYSMDSYGGGQLLEWLNLCIFPNESNLIDPGFGEQAAHDFVDMLASSGTTTSLVFGSQFPHAQDALFAEFGRRGLRTVCGRTTMTVGPPSASRLLTSEDEAIRLTTEEIDRWHAADTGDPATARLHVAVVPRFALSVTPQTLRSLGDLYASVRDRGVYFTSHLNENNRPGTGEVDSVKQAFGVNTYLDVYDGKFLPGSARGGESLLGPRSVMAHGVHCQDEELARLAETGTSIGHCPVSQLFLGSGTMPWRRTIGAGVNVALGTDFAGGDESLLLRVLNDCFKVHMNEPGDAAVSLHPAELLFTATVAGARALALEDRIGNLDAGKEADFVVLDPDRWAPLARSLRHSQRADDATLARDQILFALIMTSREPAIDSVYVQGSKVHCAP
ncbi:MAG: guanine deaminase [Actinomycetes bacterium]